MSLYCALLARLAGFDTDRAELIRIASPMHDVGKIGIPDRILLKPGTLTDEERQVMEAHAEMGHRILAGSNVELLDLAALMALTHHERIDGTGYPHGLAGEEIPIEGRIAAVADVFDALTSDRVYRPAFQPDEARTLMFGGRGTQFDAGLLDLFFGAFDDVLAIRRATADGPRVEPARVEPAQLELADALGGQRLEHLAHLGDELVRGERLAEEGAVGRVHDLLGLVRVARVKSTRSDGRSSVAILASVGPLIPGITTSVRSRSIGAVVVSRSSSSAARRWRASSTV